MNALTPLNSTMRRACSETTSVGRPRAASRGCPGAGGVSFGTTAWLLHRDSTRVAGSAIAIDRAAVAHHQRELAKVADVGERIRVEHQQVGALACFERAEVVEAARRDRAVLRRGDDRLRRRHAELDQAFDGDDAADAVILRVGLGAAARELRRRRPIVVGADGDHGAGGNQLLRVTAPHLQLDGVLDRALPQLGAGPRRAAASASSPPRRAWRSPRRDPSSPSSTRRR